MGKQRQRALVLAATLTFGSFGSAGAADFGAGTSLAGGAPSLRADQDGIGISGEVRTPLSALAGDGAGDWLSRVRGGYDYHSAGANRFWIETIQPLAQSAHHTVFWQARVSHAHEDQTLNAGLGYRWLTPDANWLLGVNSFYDYSLEAKHRRASLGAEALGPFVSFRANIYQAISNWRSLGAGVREHALDGADAAVDAQAPYMAWLRLGARYFEWRGIDGPDAKGLQGTLNADVTEHLQLVGTYAGDDDPEGEYFFGLRLRLAGGGRPNAAHQFWSSRAFVARDLSRSRLEFVERENRIITESQGGPYASGSITVSRGE